MSIIDDGLWPVSVTKSVKRWRSSVGPFNIWIIHRKLLATESLHLLLILIGKHHTESNFLNIDFSVYIYRWLFRQCLDSKIKATLLLSVDSDFSTELSHNRLWVSSNCEVKKVELWTTLMGRAELCGDILMLLLCMTSNKENVKLW